MMAKSKLNSIETLASQALIDMEISHEEFITILKEKDEYEKMKENGRNVNEKQENMRLNSVNSKSLKKVGGVWLTEVGILTSLKMCEFKWNLWNSLHRQKKNFFCLSVRIKCVKSAKKHMKNVILKLLMIKNTFG